jgi:hypothetical protein
MPFAVTATIDGHIVSIPADTAKEAFAKAIDWQVAKQINDVAISDGSDNYSMPSSQGRWLFPRLPLPFAIPDTEQTSERPASVNRRTLPQRL